MRTRFILLAPACILITLGCDRKVPGEAGNHQATPLGIGASTNAASGQRDPLTQEVISYLGTLRSAVWIEDAGSWFTSYQLTGPKDVLYLEAKSLQYRYSPNEATEADKLNGVDWRGHAVFTVVPTRTYSERGTMMHWVQHPAGWTQWKNEPFMNPGFKVTKVNGSWSGQVLEPALMLKPSTAEIHRITNRLTAEERVQLEAQQLAAQQEQQRQREEKLKQEENKRIADSNQREARRQFEAGKEAFKRGLFREGVAELESAMKLGSDKAVNELAWHFATCRDPKQHNGKRAVELAMQATQLKPDEEDWLDTLAAAYARNGQFDQAINTMLRAITKGYVRGGTDRLDLYRKQKAYQQPD